MLVGTPHQVLSAPINFTTFVVQEISLSAVAINLGVRINSHIMFDSNIKHLFKNTFFQLRNLAKLRPLLYLLDVEKLVHAFVSLRLHYGMFS